MKTVQSGLAKYVLLGLVVALGALLTGCASEATPVTRGPLVLLTDFGEGDYRVASMKGTIYSAYPDVKLVDGTHSIPAFDIATGAYILQIAAASFPEETVFIAAVAPGAPERYLVLTTDNNQAFVLPDNGLVTYVARDAGIKSVREITNQDLFDGPIEELAVREVLGTAGALVASGRNPEDFGPSVSDPQFLDVQEAKNKGGKLLGAIVFVDNFGNSITNIPEGLVNGLGLSVGDRITVATPQGYVEAVFGATYGDVPRGDSVALVSSLGVLQLAINRGNFASTYSVEAGSSIEVARE